MWWRLDPGQIEVVDEAVAAVLRQKTPAEKLAMVAAANCTARTLVAAGVRLRHPDWPEPEVEREVVRRMTRDPG